MRKKIKQLMNKEEGFTLVELLAVIVILGIIIAISIPAIGGVISNATEDSKAASIDLIEDSARIYFTQNGDTDTGSFVLVDTLLSEDYVELRGSDNPGGYVIIEEDATGNRIYTHKTGEAPVASAG